MREWFRRLASAVTTAVGSPWALLAAIATIAVWLVSGPLFGFSDTWQLAINTGTTIVTFLMVFVIQASQNREARATQLKLDELIRAVRGARNDLIALEDAPEETVELHRAEFQALVHAAHGRAAQGPDSAAREPGRDAVTGMPPPPRDVPVESPTPAGGR